MKNSHWKWKYPEYIFNKRGGFCSEIWTRIEFNSGPIFMKESRHVATDLQSSLQNPGKGLRLFPFVQPNCHIWRFSQKQETSKANPADPWSCQLSHASRPFMWECLIAISGATHMSRALGLILNSLTLILHQIDSINFRWFTPDLY